MRSTADRPEIHFRPMKLKQPYYKAVRGSLVHVVHQAELCYWDSRPSHPVITALCGATTSRFVQGASVELMIAHCGGESCRKCERKRRG